MSKVSNALKSAVFYVREFALWYEPAVAKAIVAAFFQMLLGLGVAVGDFPAKVDAVLAFVTVVTTLVAGKSIRSSVYSPATHRSEVERAEIRARSLR